MTDMPVGERRQLAPPVSETGAFGWARKHLFSSWLNGLTTIVLIVAIAWVLSWFLEWAVFTANFTASTGSECRGQVMRLVLLPQALRVIVPPMTSQYLNITKNSSLAIAIGYPDLVASINVTINQTGQAIENVLIIMAAYLSVSLSISAFMNWYNKRIALRER